MRRPPRSTLVPYTTLLRAAFCRQGPRLIGLCRPTADSHPRPHGAACTPADVVELTAASAHPRAGAGRIRSEEHTSELQSRQYLVCRLLLEKKNLNFCQTSL